MSHRSLMLGALCAALAFTVACQQGGTKPVGTRTVVISAVDRDYAEVPVCVELPNAAQAKSVRIPNVPCQLQQRDGKTLLWLVVRNLKQGQSQTLSVTLDDAPSPGVAGQFVPVTEEDGTVTIEPNGELLTRYEATKGPKPYLFPVIAPNGKEITRSFPIIEGVEGETTDHRHHRSWWFDHGDVNGVDFWSEGERAGKQVHQAFEAVESGTVVGIVRARNHWTAPDGTKVCEDVREIRAYYVLTGRLVDYEMTVYATDGPVTFGDTKEGSFGLRVKDTMKVDARLGGRIVNSEDQTDGDAWGQRATWCDYYGPVDDEVVGVAILDHPDNLRHPTYWHVRTYGLFAANPFGIHDFVRGQPDDAGDFTIPAGGSQTWRYRVFVHEGDTEAAKVADVWAAYSNPPKVTVTE